MKRFADLYEALDSTTSTLAKVEAMARYFREAPRQDAAWALWFLTGRRPKRLLGTRLLVEWTLELTGTPDWLFSESYAVVGRPGGVHRPAPRRRDAGGASRRHSALDLDGGAHPPAARVVPRGAEGGG